MAKALEVLVLALVLAGAMLLLLLLLLYFVSLGFARTPADHRDINSI
jgi:hypothetical protein